MDDHGNRVSLLTDADIDRIADRVIDKFGDRWISRDQHHADHVWCKAKRDGEVALSESKRRILEKVVGTASAVGLLGLLAWVGDAVIKTLASLIAKSGGG